MSIFTNIVMQDVKLAFKKGSGIGNLLAFFVISAALFPFGVGGSPELLQNIGVGVIWVCALLSSMLSITKVFDEDYDDGTLSQLVLTGILPEMLVLAKILSHWLTSNIPLIIATPLLAVLFNIEKLIFPLMAALLVGTFTISIISAIGASLTLSLKKGGGLVSILVLPLYIPTLIFGVGASASAGDGFISNISLLVGLLLFMLPVGVFASSSAVKIAIEDG